MFANACARVTEFTRPVVISTRHQDGSVTTECATFIVLNSDGWIMTAAHVYDSYKKYQSDVNKANEINEINERRVDKPGEPSSKIKLDPTMIINHSFWWGWDGAKLVNGFYDRQLDLLVGKLEGFDPSWVRHYPVFRDPDTIRPGTSVCRSGFPFINIESTWNEEHHAFAIPRIPVKDIIFHNEGMHTRTVDHGPCRESDARIRYVETSTPGLRGQSGGPIFDSEGRIYAMQVKTMHIPLGFHPTVEYQGSTVIENQFMNVGLGIHASSLMSYLDSKGVRYDSEKEPEEFRIVA